MTPRLRKLRRAMLLWGIDVLRLNHRDNVAWLTQGATYHVVERAEQGVASLLVTASYVYLVAPDNEIDRLLQEEPCPFPVEPLTYPWYADETSAIPTRLSSMWLGSDVPWNEAEVVDDRLIDLRYQLDSKECERFARLGHEAARLVETVARGVRPGMTERQVEAEILHDCLAVGIRPVCTLVAFDDRIDRFPHPIPTARRLRHRALITLGAARDGLNVSLTRLVRFDPLDETAREDLKRLAAIHAKTLAALRPGLALASLFDTIRAAYAEVGAPESWRRHHLGGPAGYGCRDRILMPDIVGHVVAPQAFAFNPTLPGSKSEDTVLLHDDKIEWLTRSGDWPLIEIEHDGQIWQFTDWLVLDPATPRTT